MSEASEASLSDRRRIDPAKEQDTVSSLQRTTNNRHHDHGRLMSIAIEAATAAIIS